MAADGGWRMKNADDKMLMEKRRWEIGDIEICGWQNADNKMLVANEPGYLKEVRQAQLFTVSHKTDQNTVHRQGKKNRQSLDRITD